MKTQIEIAREIATKAHSYQYRTMGADKGKSYIVHPMRVAEMVPHCNEEIVAAAWLHDVLEDTKVTADDLLDAGINPSVITLVKILTRNPGENYFDFIMRIKQNTTALTIKAADIRDNMESLEEGNLKDKYRLALHVLTCD
jgi:GTP diphosphokinase / guanosine-3',5'-bis(diphosphate) 3'-diphosphatase